MNVLLFTLLWEITVYEMKNDADADILYKPMVVA